MHLRMNFHQQTQQKYRRAIPILESCIHAGGGGGAHPGLPPPSHEKNTTFLSSDVSHFLRWCLNKICSSLWRYLENQSSDGGQLYEICMKVKVVINYSDMKVEKRNMKFRPTWKFRNETWKFRNETWKWRNETWNSGRHESGETKHESGETKHESGETKPESGETKHEGRITKVK